MDRDRAETAAQVAIYQERKDCRACGSRQLELVLSLGNQYLPRWADAVNELEPRAPLELVRCGGCGLLQLKHTVQSDLLFREYWYRTGINNSMREAMQDLVNDGLRYHRSGGWLDIGANDGYLLSRLPKTFSRVACEPALNVQAALEEHANVVIPDYFKASLVRAQHDEPFRVITSAAMFYDLDDPLSFLKDIRSCLASDGVWINQLNDSPTMLRQNAFDAICHEHLCYYDASSLAALYRSAGLKIIDIDSNDVNGGSIRVTAAKDTSRHTPFVNLAGYGQPSAQDCQRFATRVRRWRQLMLDFLNGPMTNTQTMWLYGASTKGTVLLQYLDCSTRFMAIAERNPMKVGKTLVGSWIPIVDEATMRKAKPDWLMVLPWAFRNEFIERERPLRDAGTAMVFPLPNLEIVL